MNEDLRRLERRGLALLCLVTLLVFATSLFGEFVWDDRSLILENENIRNPQDFWELVATPFWADLVSDGGNIAPLYALLHRPLIKVLYHVGMEHLGGTPLVFHLVSASLHLANTRLVFALVRDRVGRPSAESSLAGLMAAGLFAVHPSRAESVAWISGITDVAMTFFLLLGIRCLGRAESPSRLALGFVALVLAGWSKETAVLAPLLLAAEHFALGTDRRHALRSTLVALAASGVVVVTGLLAISGSPRLDATIRGGALVPRVFATLGVIVERTFWPVPPTLYPGIVTPDPRVAPVFPLGMLIVGGLCASLALGLFGLALRKPDRRTLLLPLVWFFVPLLPVLNFVPRSAASLTADRFLYLPLVGVCLGLSAWIRPHLAAQSSRRAAVLGAYAAMLIFASLETMRSNERFNSPVTLYSAEITDHPSHHAARIDLIRELRRARRLDEAMTAALEGARLAHSRGERASELQFVLLYAGVLVEATPTSDRALLLRLGASLDGVVERHRLELDTPRLRFRASVPASLASSLATADADADGFAIPRALAHLKTEDLVRAESLLDALLQHQPGRLDANELLVLTRVRRGDLEGARAALARARIRLPDSTRLNELEELIARITQLRSARFADPRMTTIRDANLDLMAGGFASARERLRPLLERPPVPLPALILAAQVEEADGSPERALAILDQALASAPGQPQLLEARRSLESRGGRRPGFARDE